MTDENRTSTDGKYAIEVNGLSVYYGAFRALKSVDLEIQRRKITAIIGPSGCGKSTMLRAFNRMNELVPTAPQQRETEDYISGRFG
jgi:phosphate transport system ATP-binding protein